VIVVASKYVPKSTTGLKVGVMCMVRREKPVVWQVGGEIWIHPDNLPGFVAGLKEVLT
jgi:hypothetical protein